MTVLRVLAIRQLSAGTFCLSVEKPEFTIRAGQCFSVGLKKLGVNREYSIYSGVDDPHLSFLVREIPDGIVSSHLAKCSPGDPVEIGGPYGDFCLQEKDIEKKQFFFIASGTGIAPFHSFVRTYPNLNFKVFHGIRYEDETYDKHDYANGEYLAAVSRPTGTEVPIRVTDVLMKVEICDDALYYLCGNQKMITDSIGILMSRGVPGGSIYTETFF